MTREQLERLVTAALTAKMTDGCPCCGLDGVALLDMLADQLVTEQS